MPNDLIEFPGKAKATEEVIRPSEVSPENLTQYTEQWLAGITSEVLREVKKSIIRRLKKDDYRATQQAGEMLGLLKGSQGVVINNLMQANISGKGDDDSIYFEKIVHMMEERDRQVVEVKAE